MTSSRCRAAVLVLTMLVAGFGLLLATPATAQREEGMRPPGPGRHHRPPPLHRMLERHADRLGLDDATQASIRSIADESHEAAFDTHEELRAAHDELRALLSEEQPDEAAVMEQAEVIGLLKTEERKSRLRTMLQIRALLTPEQRQELVKIRAEERPRRGEKRRGGRFEDGPPPPAPGR